MTFTLYMRETQATSGPFMTEKSNFFDQVKNYERKLICQALAYTQGHQARAARLLGLPPTTLASQLRRLGIDARSFRKPGELFSLTDVEIFGCDS
jgi:transcriptional regulator with GAF, ATPase, and Fis domain